MYPTNTMLINLAQAGGKPTGWVWVLAICFALICLFMMLVVLIQKPKGGGLSGAFGGGAGGGSSQAVLGARVGDWLTWTTVICFVLFLSLAAMMTWAINDTGPASAEEQAAETETEAGDATDATPGTTGTPTGSTETPSSNTGSGSTEQ